MTSPLILTILLRISRRTFYVITAMCFILHFEVESKSHFSVRLSFIARMHAKSTFATPVGYSPKHKSLAIVRETCLLLLFNDHLHLREDFVILGVIFSSMKKRRNVVVQFSGVRGCRKAGDVILERCL